MDSVIRLQERYAVSQVRSWLRRGKLQAPEQPVLYDCMKRWPDLVIDRYYQKLAQR